MEADIAHLLDAARTDGRRRVLGIVGGPGAGKSTLAASLAGPEVAVVGMDGWHLANSVLDRLGRRDRKGAPDTFDAAGYVAFLDRLRSRAATVWAPEFRREIEEPIAGALEVPPEALVVVTEGNYLLVDEPPWDGVRPLLDEAWFLDPRRGRPPRPADRPPRAARPQPRRGGGPRGRQRRRQRPGDRRDGAPRRRRAHRLTLTLRSPTPGSGAR